MLQAFIKSKARRFLIDRSSTKIPTEDIMTSCVFGGLTYFPDRQRTTLVNAMVEPSGFYKFAQVSNVELWPRIRLRNGDIIEPDACITGKALDGADYTLLIECKWADRLKAEQLEKQSDYLSTLGQVTAHMIVLQEDDVRDSEKFTAVLASSGVSQVVSWRELGEYMNAYWLQHMEGEDGAWARDVSLVIDEAGYPPFRSWSKVTDICKKTCHLLPKDIPNRLFFSIPQNEGVGSAAKK